MLTSSLSRSMYASAHGSAMGRKDQMNKHNNAPVITCEGDCASRKDTLWQEHLLVSELYDKAEYRFEQIYCCSRCGTKRRFGLTEARVTGKGDQN